MLEERPLEYYLKEIERLKRESDKEAFEITFAVFAKNLESFKKSPQLTLRLVKG